jgi:branched-chain amino acid transport system substrate-binding protein
VKKTRWLMGLLVVLAVVASSCGGDDDEADDSSGAGTETPNDGGDNGGATDVGVTATEIKVGQVITKTGSAATASADFDKGFEAYIEKVNDDGGIHGRKIVALSPRDDTGDANRNKAEIEASVVQDQVFTVAGCFPVFGGVAYVDATKLPLVGCAFDVTWEKSDYALGYAGTWLDKTPDDDPPALPVANVAYVMEKLGKKRLAVFSYQHVGSKQLSEQSCQWAEANYGHECVFEDYTLQFGFTDLGASVQKLRDAKPDFIWGGMDAGGALTIVRSLKRAGIDIPSMWAVPPSTEQAEAATDLIGDLYGVAGTPPFDGDNPAMKEMVAEVNARKPGTSMSFAVVGGWATADLLVKGLDAAGPNLTRDSFHKAIRSMKAFESGVGATVDFTKSPEEKIREGIKPDPSLCAGYLMRGDQDAKKLVQVGPEPQLCLAGIDTPAALKAYVDKDKSSLEP